MMKLDSCRGHVCALAPEYLMAISRVHGTQLISLPTLPHADIPSQGGARCKEHHRRQNRDLWLHISGLCKK